MQPTFVAAPTIPFGLLEAPQAIMRHAQTFNDLRPFTPTLFHLR
jgi:hypothetical protein